MSLIEQTQTLARIVAKCRVDADYKSSLISDPVTVLRDGGVDIPDGLSIEFVPSGQDVPASTQEVAYVSIDVLDRDPGLLTEEALSHVSAGACKATALTGATPDGAASAGLKLTLVGNSTLSSSTSMCY
jgi:hypothetical protein